MQGSGPKVTQKMRKRKIKSMCYKYSLFTVLGVTRAFSRADYHIPVKWYSLIDSLRVSSSVLHDRVSTIDEDVERDFRRKEEMLDRRLGNKKFYDEDEVKELQERFNEIEI